MELHHGGQAFIISDKNYSLAMLVRLEVLGVDSLDESEKVTAEEEGCNFLLTVARPVVDSISSSIDIFAALHDQVMIQTDVTKVSRLTTKVTKLTVSAVSTASQVKPIQY